MAHIISYPVDRQKGKAGRQGRKTDRQTDRQTGKVGKVDHRMSFWSLEPLTAYLPSEVIPTQ